MDLSTEDLRDDAGVRVSSRSRNLFLDRKKKSIASNRTKLTNNNKKIDSLVGLKIEKFMLNDAIYKLSLPLPLPSSSYLSLLSSISSTYNIFGKYLNFLQPDFLTLTLQRTSIVQAFDWIIPIIQKNPSLINRLPPR